METLEFRDDVKKRGWPQAAERAKAEGPPLGVLMVEDNDGDYVVVREMFQELRRSGTCDHPLRCTRVARLGDVAAQLAAEPCDVVLLDLSLPDSEGLGTLGVCRELAPGAAIVVLSGLDDLEMAVRAVHHGAQDYLIKNQIDADLLYRSIRYAHERKRRELERSELEAQVRHVERLKSLGLLSGGIAHDFNNLLLVVLANIGLARKSLPPDAPAAQCLERAAKAVGLATGLTKQLLAYSGNRSLAVEPVIISALIQEMRPLLEAAASARTARIVFSTCDNTPAIAADPSQITQVVMNLVMNAVEALGGGAGEITVSCGTYVVPELRITAVSTAAPQQAGEHVFIAVSDTGSGIEPTLKSKLFDPFVTTKGAGRGLGLSAVWGIVRNLRGYIEVDSTLGEGSSFKVFLPTAPAKPMDAHQTEASARARVDPGSILVVDDNELVRSVTAEMLGKAGFTAVCAHNGAEALKIFSRDQSTIRLAIVDLSLTDMDGLALFEQLRKIRRDIPIIFSSGYPETELVAAQREKGNLGYLQKPFENDVLIRQINSLLID